MAKRAPRILGIDAGGTMTDTFLIDEEGRFIVGKAQTTAYDESVGFLASMEDGLKYWDLKLEEGIGTLRTGIYSGTAMLNRMLERKGRRVGLIVSGGMEDYLRTERGIQTYLGYSYSDRLHLVTHHHNEPLVPRNRIFGVRGRIDVFGKEAIPLYEKEVYSAVETLLDRDAESIVVCLLFSYKNGAHEKRIGEIAREVMAKRGKELPIYLSSELYPVRQDMPRLNSTLMEAYAAEPSRTSLTNVRKCVRDHGGRFDLRVMASHGGTISMDARELARTMISGPIGGVIGARYLGAQIGVKHLACSDIGGTSFDLALVTEGEFEITQTPDIARFLLSMPLVRIDSVGAGTGSFVRVNPTSNRIEVGPDSAGARIGMCWEKSGVNTVSITDCNVVLGYINPDFFLGGEITLDRQRAIDAVEVQIAKPLGLDVYKAAQGVIELFEDSLKSSLLGKILGQGYTPASYNLLSYGGGGPLHVAGYSDGLAFDDVLVPAWAPGFSAFGCACGDYEYRFDKTLDLALLPKTPAEDRQALVAAINGAWAQLRAEVEREFAKSDVPVDRVGYRPAVRMLYYGQLNALEVASPKQQLESAEDLNLLIKGFEELYSRIYGLGAKTPQFGYTIAGVVMSGSTEVEKPILPREPLAGPDDWKDLAVKGGRPVYYRSAWHEATLVDLEKLPAGSDIPGPAVVESPSSTMFVPPGRRVRLDEHRIFHMSVRAAAQLKLAAA
ncbi:MAG: hydantoinase/oxoprolinase family protein [Gammaproteobacteria bacterium]|nr:hydantoinase/oxoprolinase family protein [Gammaproteobacteria bacterium]